jgi:hypothetical protein
MDEIGSGVYQSFLTQKTETKHPTWLIVKSGYSNNLVNIGKNMGILPNNNKYPLHPYITVSRTIEPYCITDWYPDYYEEKAAFTPAYTLYSVKNTLFLEKLDNYVARC